MNYRKGERVRHPTMGAWGLGEVLENSRGGTVRVFFVGVGEKTLVLQHVQPVKVEGSEADHPVLDNLRVVERSTGIQYRSLPHSIEYFLSQFPQGFYGEKFHEQERDYKVQAHDLAMELLDAESVSSLLAAADYPEIAKRALRVVNATNLIFPNEKMALKDGLASPEAMEAFARGLADLLYGDADLEPRFVAFARVLETMGAAKWTTVSYFLFIVQPQRYMFVKPTITRYAADVCAFEINYVPQLNWRTYQQVLAFSDYLERELVELKPRDMIDVQSFMWCIAHEKYGLSE